MLEDFTKKNIIWYGRNFDFEGCRYFSYSASGFCFVLKGKKASAKILSDSRKFKKTEKALLGIFINEGNDTSWSAFKSEPEKKVLLVDDETNITLFESEQEKTVCIRVIKLSEAAFGSTGLKELWIEGNLLTPKNPQQDSSFGKIEFIGDSITCGYGIDGKSEDTFTTEQERADKAYAFLTAKMLNAEFQNCSWSGIGVLSCWVEPKPGNLPITNLLMPSLWPYTDKSLCKRLKTETEIWDEKKFSPDIIVIHLGTNDASYVQENEDRRLCFLSNYRSLIEAVHRRSPNAKICCCLGAMGQDLCSTVTQAVKLFKEDFPDVTIKAITLPLQNEEKDGVGADWHPSAKTHEKLAKILSRELRKLKK